MTVYGKIVRLYEIDQRPVLNRAINIQHWNRTGTAGT